MSGLRVNQELGAERLFVLRWSRHNRAEV